LVVGRDPEDERVRVLAPIKSNLGPMPRALTYTLEPVGHVARIGWGNETQLTANEILSHPSTDGAMAKAVEFLKKLLSGGAIPAAKVTEEAAAAGISEKTLRRAKKKLGVKAVKSAFGGGWLWELPAEDGHEGGQTQDLATFAGNGRESPVSPEDGQHGQYGQHGHLGTQETADEVCEWTD
jgi:hypothetical protein